MVNLKITSSFTSEHEMSYLLHTHFPKIFEKLGKKADYRDSKDSFFLSNYLTSIFSKLSTRHNYHHIIRQLKDKAVHNLSCEEIKNFAISKKYVTLKHLKQIYAIVQEDLQKAYHGLEKVEKIDSFEDLGQHSQYMFAWFTNPATIIYLSSFFKLYEHDPDYNYDTETNVKLQHLLAQIVLDFYKVNRATYHKYNFSEKRNDFLTNFIYLLNYIFFEKHTDIRLVFKNGFWKKLALELKEIPLQRDFFNQLLILHINDDIKKLFLASEAGKEYIEKSPFGRLVKSLYFNPLENKIKEITYLMKGAMPTFKKLAESLYNKKFKDGAEVENYFAKYLLNKSVWNKILSKKNLEKANINQLNKDNLLLWRFFIANILNFNTRRSLRDLIFTMEERYAIMLFRMIHFKEKIRFLNNLYKYYFRGSECFPVLIPAIENSQSYEGMFCKITFIGKNIQNKFIYNVYFENTKEPIISEITEKELPVILEDKLQEVTDKKKIIKHIIKLLETMKTIYNLKSFQPKMIDPFVHKYIQKYSLHEAERAYENFWRANPEKIGNYDNTSYVDISKEQFIEDLMQSENEKTDVYPKCIVKAQFPEKLFKLIKGLTAKDRKLIAKELISDQLRDKDPDLANLIEIKKYGKKKPYYPIWTKNQKDSGWTFEITLNSFTESERELLIKLDEIYPKIMKLELPER